MKQAFKNITDATGNTPIVRLNTLAQNCEAELYVKLEYLNPGGSIKDRVGIHILKKAYEEGRIGPGSTIVESTSGNTGVGLALFAATHQMKCVFTLSDKQSPQKVSNLRAMGAQVIVCPDHVAPEDPRSYYSVAKKVIAETPGAFFVNQYHNPDNPEAHYQTTGPEISKQTAGEFDYFVCGVGTGGTISGIGRYLKEHHPHIKTLGVDPEGSILTHYFRTGEIIEVTPYKTEGIGEDFIPGNIDFSLIDDMVQVSDRMAFITTRRLLRKEGIYGGGSCGSAVYGALSYIEQHPEKTRGKKFLIILPDSGARYSERIYNDEWLREQGIAPEECLT